MIRKLFSCCSSMANSLSSDYEECTFTSTIEKDTRCAVNGASAPIVTLRCCKTESDKKEIRKEVTLRREGTIVTISLQTSPFVSSSSHELYIEINELSFRQHGYININIEDVRLKAVLAHLEAPAALSPFSEVVRDHARHIQIYINDFEAGHSEDTTKCVINYAFGLLFSSLQK